MSEPIGEDLWKNVQSVRVSQDGGIEMPVRADGEHGIVIGVDAIATQHQSSRSTSAKPRSRFGSFLRRLMHRGG